MLRPFVGDVGLGTLVALMALGIGGVAGYQASSCRPKSLARILKVCRNC
jgi:hypothetical protein